MLCNVSWQREQGANAGTRTGSRVKICMDVVGIDYEGSQPQTTSFYLTLKTSDTAKLACK